MIEVLSTYQRKALDIILAHKASDPITGAKISQLIGLTPRATGKEGADMRQIIHALRVKGYPVCAHGEGYYYAADEAELLSFIADFQGRVNKQQEAIEGLKKAQGKIGVVPETTSQEPLL